MNLICTITFVLCFTFLKAENKYFDLNNGLKIPAVGYGTLDEALEKALDAALEAGYRHIDTETVYENEEVIRNVLKRWLSSGKITRDNLFLTTKLLSVGMRPEHVQIYLKDSLKKLQVDYLDLCLLHGPIGFQYETGVLIPVDSERNMNLDLTTNLTAIWKAMEDQVDLGLTKTIGVSNFNSSQLERILNVARIPPVTDQIEHHLYFQQKEIVKFCKEHDIVVTAYSPLGSPGLRYLQPGEAPNNDLNDPVVLDLAKKYNKSPAQILLRHAVQKGVVVIPKSKTPARIQQNIDLFDFELCDTDMKVLNGLDKGLSGKIKLGAFKEIERHPEAGEHLW